MPRQNDPRVPNDTRVLGESGPIPARFGLTPEQIAAGMSTTADVVVTATPADTAASPAIQVLDSRTAQLITVAPGITVAGFTDPTYTQAETPVTVGTDVPAVEYAKGHFVGKGVEHVATATGEWKVDPETGQVTGQSSKKSSDDRSADQPGDLVTAVIIERSADHLDPLTGKPIIDQMATPAVVSQVVNPPAAEPAGPVGNVSETGAVEAQPIVVEDDTQTV